MSTALLSVTEQLDAIEQNNRILAIDDDSAVLDYYREIFDPAGGKNRDVWNALMDVVGDDEHKHNLEAPQYDLTTATSGEKAVHLAQQGLSQQSPYSVAFVDMRMPGGMDGLETAQELRALDSRIMLVIVTAYSDYQLEEIQRRLLHDVLFLNKPLSMDEAMQTVRMLNQNWKDREKNKVMKMQMVSHAKMAGLGNMAVRIGHEINQPLSYINGMLQLQKMGLEQGDELDVEEMVSEVDLALQQTVRIKEIIDSLRVFAHPDKKCREDVVLAQALEHVQRIFKGRLESQRITFRVQLEDQQMTVHANPSQLQRVLTNLISNAIDALLEKRETEGSGWKAEISLEARLKRDRHQVQIDFLDNGTGIPLALQGRMFDPFVTTKEPGKGTGLGLSEIHGMLKEHNASIEYQAVPGQEGAHFIMMFPSMSPDMLSVDEES
ncbi:MAG: response regulator [Gammaproteobacteria bacterium]|jgi:C4-dicarboxylate-specific signal transduction histidine kinase|nr:response regulator [Gammaproteobacteria bacterium]MBT4608147.1 response regulator [Thiotrichales bacterium]MBT3471905.1 response regulator [Gammaproteobacteria bacterium]MBT3966673.1 response regulator [Gammaproteobacteria bacterium]MBT4081892.1 response regulator [Gammaproteobacteria bacterium]